MKSLEEFKTKNIDIISNNVVLFGTLVNTDVEFITLKNKEYSVIYIDVIRKNIKNSPQFIDRSDRLRLIMSEVTKDVFELMKSGITVCVTGEVGSYNIDNEKGKKSTYLCVNSFKIEDATCIAEPKNNNDIKLVGELCKEVKTRKTPNGKVIADLLIASLDSDGTDIYVYSIAWNNLAKLCEKAKVGDYLSIWGRMESRPYTKQLGDGNSVQKVAYEVSANCLKWYPKE